MADTSPSVTIITPHPESWVKHAHALWQAKRLVYWLVRRDLTLRYRQTWMGFLWAVLYPAALFGIYLFSLGYLAKLPLPSGTSYSIYILTGLVPWIYFQNALLAASSALQQNMNLISKVYFPRLALIATAFLTASFDFLWMALALLVVALCYGLLSFHGLSMIVFWSGLAGLLGLSMGIWVSVVSVRYRDLQLALPVLMQMTFFLSPVVYAAYLVPGRYLNWYYFNPMTAIIESFRAGFGLESIVNGQHQLVAIAVTAAALVFSLRHFHAVERELVDRM